MKKIYIFLLLSLLAGLNCYAQADRQASKQQRIDAAKAFIEKGAELSPYSVKDFLQASGYVFFPETYSKDLQKRADKGDLKAMRDVIYHITLTCDQLNKKECQKVYNLILQYQEYRSTNQSNYGHSEDEDFCITTLNVIEFVFAEQGLYGLDYNSAIEAWQSLYTSAPGNVPISNCYARALINSFFKSNSYKNGDYFTIGNRLLLRNEKEHEDIMSVILMIKMYQYQAHKSDPESWQSAINGYRKVLSEFTDGQITDVPFDESSTSSKFIF